MGRLIDCQASILQWGEKTRFRLARVGLMRKGSTVYLALFFKDTNINSSSNKFPLIRGSFEILPAAIRFKDLRIDLFIRNLSDEKRYEAMVRAMKIILKEGALRQSGKGETFDKFISSIPTLNEFSPNDLAPLRTRPPLSLSLKATNQNADRFDVDGNMVNDVGGRQAKQGNNNPAKDRSDRRKLLNTQLRRITISGLESIPDELWLRNSLNELTLTECSLTNVPKQLEQFSTSLSSLDLSDNRIDKLPRTFCCKMNKLKFLNLRHNHIEILPIEIKFFSRLVELNISNNRLRMLPSTFSDLRSLEKLDVANNNLSQLPAFRKEDIRLKYLDVSYNPLDGASNEANTFQIHPSIVDDALDYNQFINCALTPVSKNKFPTLFETSMLNIVRCDRLLKLASEEPLPRTIVSTMQRDIFKCYRCSRMSLLPAYNSTDILDYVEQVEYLVTTGNYHHGMTFMKLLCSDCFDNMSS